MRPMLGITKTAGVFVNMEDAFPRSATILGKKYCSPLGYNPPLFCIDKVNIQQEVRDRALLLHPGFSTIAGVKDRSLLSYRPTVLVI